ncbi:MAG: rRNA maturation RNase YbeY [Bacteroidales bacterium]|jgi:rRNA maturation RNase YbeY|nr:rRNA maturation RNase YbeY [Bacteroidales bacterium]
MINFYEEDIKSHLRNRRVIKQWIKDIISSYNYSTGNISYIFCSDDYLLNINRQYLSHDYYTDVITFDYDENNIVSGDIFISVDTVKSNSEQYSVSYNCELYRVIIHGVLHLCGLKDKTPEDAKIMREAEEKSLQILRSQFSIDDF